MTVIRIVDIIPTDHSDDAGLSWQPSIAVNPDNPNQIVITTTDVPEETNVGYWFSLDRGSTWQSNFSQPGNEMDQSPTLAASGELYWAIASSPGAVLHVLRSPNLLASGPLPEIDKPLRQFLDQPYTLSFTQHQPPQPDKDRVYVGYVQHDDSYSAMATIDVCLDARVVAAGALNAFETFALDHRAAVPLDGYEVRPTAHGDGTVYVAFKSWRSQTATTVRADIVVERDDTWGSGGFIALIEPSDNKPGLLVAPNVRIHDGDNQTLGGQRL